MVLVAFALAAHAAAAQPAEPSAAGLQATGPLADQWHVTETASAIDNTHTYATTLLAENEVTNLIDRPEKPVLGFTCNAKGLFLSVIWPDAVDNPFHDFRVPVPYRADDAKPGSERWIATAHSIAKVGGEALTWLNANSKVHKLVVRVPDAHGGQEATFDTEGLSQLVTKLDAMSCG